MTQLFDDKGDVRPVTVLQAGPCVVTQRKTAAKDGYDAAQIGLVEFVKESRLTKPMKGHFAKNNLPPMRLLREVAIVVDSPKSAGRTASRLATRSWSTCSTASKFVDVVGYQQGTRFCGRGEASQVCRRRGFARLDVPDHRFDRLLGVSLARVQRHAHVGTHGRGQCDDPQPAGAGRRSDENLLVVEGAVPGPKDGYVLITKAKKPPRERRGFGGSGTVDPLKASKRQAAKKK